jgi:hypothetical protein
MRGYKKRRCNCDKNDYIRGGLRCCIAQTVKYIFGDYIVEIRGGDKAEKERAEVKEFPHKSGFEPIKRQDSDCAESNYIQNCH